MRERADRDAARASRETDGERRTPAPEQARVLALQQSAGNRAVSALLSRQGAPPAPAAGTQAAAEADALRTLGLLRDTYHLMLNSPDVRVHNTALMMDPPGEREQGGRVRATPMTLRSDSAALVARNGKTAATTAYYFYGTHEDNTHEFGPNTLGTIEGGVTVVIRGTRSDGTTQTSDDIIETLVHETSHIIVKDYGEHPGTSTDAGSFDRYRDEFRSYFLAPNSTFAAIADPDARATAIRNHIVGASAGAGSYADLDKAFWAAPLDTNQFHHDALAHKRPDGFNLDNSPYLDRLVHLLRDEQAGGASVEDVLFQVAILSPKERGEAAGATLIATLLTALPARDADRIQRALTSPAAVGYGHELNPSESPRVTALLDAITARSPDGITDAYKACNPTERGELAANAHFMTWVRRALPSELLMRTCVTCMVRGGSFVYFDRVRVFAQACSDAAGQATMPDPLRAALRALPFEVRIAYFGLCQDDYAARVEPLQDPVKREVRAILRGDAEP
jgi:hypothetical protein